MSAPPKKTGLSLYANLLEPDKQQQSGATISGAPVRYDTKKNGADDAEAQRKKDAALQFQPIRRPQAQAKVTRPAKNASSRAAHMFSSSTTTASLAPTASSPDKQTPIISTPSQQPSVQRSNFEDWVGDDDDGFYYDNKPKHERGGRKKKKKGKQQQEAVRTWSLDDIYDPSMPNNYADYKGSDEQMTEIRDWKARLYYHQIKAAKKNGAARGEEAESRPAMNSERSAARAAGHSDFRTAGMFAQPLSLSFAPPSFDDPPSRPLPADDDDDYYPPSVPSRPANTSDSYEPPSTFSQTSVPDDLAGEDAYMRRMRLSSAAQMPPPMPLLPPQTVTPPASISATAPANGGKVAADITAKKAEAAAKIAAFKAKVEAHKAAKAGNGAAAASPTPPIPTAGPPAHVPQPTASDAPQDQPSPPPSPPPPPVEQQEPGATISRAPVRYQLPPALANMPATKADTATTPPANEQADDATRSNRPGQKGFAERLLKKYGWEKGKGLGAQGNEGITTAIVAKAEKRKKLADAEGGGWATSAPRGRLFGGKRRKITPGDTTNPNPGDGEEDAAQPHGALSDVVKLEGMLTSLDIDDEVQNKDLYGEIGREMESSYGKVERVFIWREAMGGTDDVFVKFTSPLSALRAVQACDGMEFAGNEVRGGFWDGERFERGEYE